MESTIISNQKALVVAVNMGYGHQRTAYPLIDLSFERKIINANDYQGIPEKDRKIWESARKFYESISRLKRIPIIGNLIFEVLIDRFQKIRVFYPKRDLSKPNSQLKQIAALIKGGWGRDLITKLSGLTPEPLPLISTFFTPAFMAEFFNYPGEIFCVVCDADISRTWAPLNPQQSKIKYFAPTERVVERLKLYGVKPTNIFLTGYPLPLENIGTEKMEILKQDLAQRIVNLDPKEKYRQKYGYLIKHNLGELPKKSDHPLTITFAVGGAGAQKEIAIKIVKSLSQKIKNAEIKMILVAGTKEWIRDYFRQKIKKLSLENKLNKNIEIIFGQNIEDYFSKFNRLLRKTDILWTKPSELSFYTALGLPIIIAPTIGSQENFNREWLLKLGSGIPQENPRYTDQWLFDLLESGWFAEAAMQGFIEGEKLSALKIKKIIEQLTK